jgi:hypothetical protein
MGNPDLPVFIGFGFVLALAFVLLIWSVMAVPLLSMNAALMALACLLFLVGFALADGTRSRSGVAT